MKRCNKCNILKEISEFGKSKQSKDGLEYYCKECHNLHNRNYYSENLQKSREYGKRYRLKNREKWLKRNALYYQENKERMRKWHKKYSQKNKEKKAEYYQNNREHFSEIGKKYREFYSKKINEYRNKLNKNNPKYKIRVALSTAIRNSLKKGCKNQRHWEEIVDFTSTQLIKHLKKTLPFGYKWQDYLDGRLHIDHKIPISVHNFSQTGQIDFKRCWALSNLQLLPAKKNLQKNNKLEKPFQPSLLLSIQ